MNRLLHILLMTVFCIVALLCVSSTAAASSKEASHVPISVTSNSVSRTMLKGGFEKDVKVLIVQTVMRSTIYTGNSCFYTNKDFSIKADRESKQLEEQRSIWFNLIEKCQNSIDQRYSLLSELEREVVFANAMSLRSHNYIYEVRHIVI